MMSQIYIIIIGTLTFIGCPWGKNLGYFLSSSSDKYHFIGPALLSIETQHIFTCSFILLTLSKQFCNRDNRKGIGNCISLHVDSLCTCRDGTDAAYGVIERVRLTSRLKYVCLVPDNTAAVRAAASAYSNLSK